jgi:hypothetical protein
MRTEGNEGREGGENEKEYEIAKFKREKENGDPEHRYRWPSIFEGSESANSIYGG